ncbi:hypothetical protein H8K33_15405 [Undibacterium amnicola]|uniref:Uncharacterized protein n=1 Tax=Undibacterium amnicola TaxID=1834038 RepID=A0ABR6XTX0_9BURK|nr:hypothetical protein [Undibacterium amnicola]MBC3832896.1 hypothetical protein [Undibacterium amnicola]
MSLLWPKSLHIGLFPGHIWLHNKRLRIEHPFTIDPLLIEQQILTVLAELLHAHKEQIDQQSHVTFFVSDRFAATTQLPWRKELFRAEEVNNFAQICFEKQFQTIDEQWLMHAEYAHYGADGIAYALRKEWLHQLDALCGQHHVIVRRILPMTAVVYFAKTPKFKQSKQLILVSESTRITAILFENQKLIGLDVEPVVHLAEHAQLRLVRRVGAMHEGIQQIVDWSVDPDSEKTALIVLGEHFPELQVKRVNRQFKTVLN